MRRGPNGVFGTLEAEVFLELVAETMTTMMMATLMIYGYTKWELKNWPLSAETENEISTRRAIKIFTGLVKSCSL